MAVSLKFTLVLCACFFTFGTTWADWSVDYWLIWADPALNPNAISNAITYYQSLHNAPSIHKFVPLVPFLIGVVGLSLGFAQMFDINFLFDGGSLALLLFALQMHASTVAPGMRIVATSEDETEVVRKLYEIAAGHTLILLAAAAMVFLQLGYIIAFHVWGDPSIVARDSPAVPTVSAEPTSTQEKKDK